MRLPRIARGVSALLVSAAMLTGCSNEEQTWEGKLATINGDLSTKADFARILDQMQAGTGHCEAEPDREAAADVLVASWQAGGKEGSLLDWAENLLAACG